MKKIPVGTIIAGKYRVVSGPCESGGTYVIYKVHHIDWDMDISMKIPREDVFTDKNDMEAIVRECGLWTELGANPYINSCYYVREIDGRPVIFSEWTEGQSLDAFISSGRLYEGSETEVQLKILDISIQILYGLRFAHSHVPPVIHGDVKPDNIIIAENGDVKLTDFGLSASGRGGFTDKFCSPEQKNGAAVTVSSDMYSWAVTVLAMYSGRMTWDDGIEAGVCCNEIFSSCRITPTEDIQAFLKLCLDTDPEKRTDICTACSSLIHRYESSSLGGRKYEQVYLQNDDQSDEIADFLNNRAICFLDNGEEEKAVEYWQKALGYMPRHPESMYNYGVYLVGTGSLYYKELCRQLREENVRDCDDYISEIRRTYSISIAGGINCCPEKILFNKDGKSILCVDGRAKVYDTVNFSLICEYDCFDDVPGSDGWVCIKSSPKDDSIAVRAVNNRACLYKKGCRLCDFVLPTDSLRYSFSPDGALFAVSDGIEYVTVYKMPENDRCRPSFNKTASCAELIQYQKRYDSCIAEFLNAMNKQNYAAALSAIDKMAQIPFLGKGPYYFGQKKKLAKFCKKTAPSVFCIKESDIRIKTAAFSYDSAYIAAACDDVFYVLIAEDLECLCKSAVESGSIISQLEFDSSLSKLYIYTEKGKKSHRLVFDIESRRIESSSVLKERPRLSVDCIPEEIDALLPEGVHCCMSPDEFSVLVWDECSCRIFHLDHELIYENRTPFPAAFLSKDKAGLFGACDKNAFLFDMLTEEQLEHFKALSEIKLENPSIRFSNDAKKAKEYLDAFEDFAPSHSDPRIRYMIECSDEEYEELMNECKRQSSFWDDKTVCSFLSLFMRTLQLGPEKADKEAQSSDVNPEAMLKAEKIPHTSAKEKRRTELTQMAKRIHDMRETLLKTVLGQEHAVHVVAEGLFNAEVLAASDTSRKRPRAVFTFAGPPGVGKTYLAEQAAELLGIPYKRFDMSEFSDEHAYEGLIGFDYTWKNSSPGKLTSFVKDNPHCILLFDEFEKSHKKTIQIFYQLLDAGIVTDRYLETRKIAAENNVLRQEDEGFSADALTSSPHVSFRDTIIIFTTNAGRSLYENDISGNNSGISAKMLLNALETEIDPLTNA
ncbi:MAG: AAA family ATPase, partial [Oscillospiraceae bacterium]